MQITATDCLKIFVLSGHEIFLNSAFTPFQKLGLGAPSVFLESPILNSFQRRGKHPGQQQLFGFLVQCVSSAESTVFLGFHSVRMYFFVFCGIVVTLLTFGTCQSNSCTHLATSLFSHLGTGIQSIKKRPCSNLAD